MKEIKALTSLRGIFAAWVILFHLAHLSPIPGVGGWAFRKGYLGVDFFFILSGFVLASAHGRTFIAPSRFADYLRFVWLRWWRLYPLHIVVTLACVLGGMLLFNDRPPGKWGFLAEITLTQRWMFTRADYTPINGPSWSISTEWYVNLLFPLLVALILRAKRLWPLAAIVAWGLLIRTAYQYDWSLDMSRTDIPWPLLRCLGEFSLGMLAFRFRAAVPALWSDRSVLLMVALLGALVSQKRTDLFVVAAMAVLVIGIAGNTARFARLLAFRPLYFLGEISFSIYLIHLPILLLVRKVAFFVEPPAAKLAVFGLGTFAATFSAAIMTYYLVEVPARSWSKRIVRRNPPAEADVLAAASA